MPLNLVGMGNDQYLTLRMGHAKSNVPNFGLFGKFVEITKAERFSKNKLIKT